MISRADIEALKEYVSNPMTSLNQAESTVRLRVTHSNLKSSFMEIRLDKHMSIDTVKNKLSSHTGTSPSSMILQLKDDQGNLIATLTDPCKPLGYYPVCDGCTMHVIDSDPMSASANGWLEDTSKVDKYVISDEDYAKRENTYRKFKEERLRADPEWTLEKEICMRRGIPYVPPPPKPEFDDDSFSVEAKAMTVGGRCEVQPGAKRGVVRCGKTARVVDSPQPCGRFVGRCAGLPAGYWVGVQFDEPVGKNNGTVKGVKYFECPSGYGGMVRPNNVAVGDFPPVDEFDFSDDEL